MLQLIAASCSICPGAQWLSWGTTWNQQRAHVLPIAGVGIPACFKSRLLDNNMCNPFLQFAKPYLSWKLLVHLLFFCQDHQAAWKKKNKEREREKNEKNAKTQAGDLCDILVEQANVCL